MKWGMFMTKRMLAAGAAVLALGLAAPISGNYAYSGIVMACEESAPGGAPEGIPYSTGIGYMSGVVSRDIYSDKDGTLLMEAKTFEVNLSQEDAVKYPKLQASLEKLSRQNLTDMDNLTTSWKPDLTESYEVGRESGMYEKGNAPFSYELSYGGLRADSTVFSCYGTEYVYLGGAHPTTAYDAYVFDTKSGKRLGLDDILQSTDNLAEIIANEANGVEEYRERLPERAELVKSIRELMDKRLLKFGLTEDGLRIFFSNYDIGPYAIGTFIIDIPQSRHFNIFNPKYIFYGSRPRG